MDKLTQEELEQLRQTIGKATMSDVGIEIKNVALVASEQFIIEDIANYLKNFAAIKRDESGNKIKNNPCLRCDLPLHRGMTEQLLGSPGGFEWGMAHGHGHCRNCYWPCQLKHRINDRNGIEIMSFSHVVLQVHPKHIEIKV